MNLDKQLSPSHAVGLELKTLKGGVPWKSSHHPTQWARKLIIVRSTPSLDSVPFPVTIPHGGLGTEIFSVGSGNRKDNIAIPRGGLGTKAEAVILLLYVKE